MGWMRRALACGLFCVLVVTGLLGAGCDVSSGSGSLLQVQPLPVQSAPIYDGSYVTRRLEVPAGYGSAGRRFVLDSRRSGGASEPLVLLLHGLYQSPQTVESATGAIDFSRSHHFTLAFPIGERSAWNAGGCCQRDTADDVGYLVDLVHYISTLTPTDLRHVYIWGFSNGAMMAWRAVCQTSGVFAGAGVMAGALLVPCPQRVHVVDIHGLLDRTVPFFGGYSTFTHTVFSNSAAERRRLAPGSTLYLVLDRKLGHRWPPLRSGGINALALFWQGLSHYAGSSAAASAAAGGSVTIEG